MKYIRWALAFAMICGANYASQALAGPVTFEDTGSANPNGLKGDYTVNYVFPSQNPTNCQGMDTCPTSGSAPQIVTVSVVVNAQGNLQTITITSSNSFPSGWDSLFINSNYTGNLSDLESWDYLVHSGNAGAPLSSITSTTPGDGLYKVVANTTGAMPNFAANVGYTYTPAGALGGGQDGRTGHADGIDSQYLKQIASIDSQHNNPTQGTLGVKSSLTTITYDFSQLTNAIYVGNSFAIGFTPYCANDVVLVATGGSAAVPEPATLVLFGMGIASLAGWRTRRSAAKKQV